MTVGPGETWARCPVCGVGLLVLERTDRATGMVTGTCGHRAYAGYVAELLYLEQRADWLTDRVREGEPAPRPDVARAYGVWPAPTAVAPTGVPTAGTGAHPPAARARPAGAQGLLLGLGAFLLVVAAVVFTAVAWPRLGAFGQVAVVLGATGLSAGVATWLRHRLRGTAETLAALAFGLALVTVAAAPALGLTPARWAEADSGYWSVTLLVVSGLALVAARSTGLRAWAWLGWSGVATGVFVTAVTVASVLGGDAWAGAATAAATALVGVVLVAAPWLQDDLAPDRGPLVLAGAGLLLAAAGESAALALDEQARPVVAVGTGLVASLLLWCDRRLTDRRPGLAGWGGWALLGVAAGVALAVLPLGPATAVGAGLLGSVVLLAGIRTGRGPLGLAVATALWLSWATCVLSSSFEVAGLGPDATDVGLFLLVTGAGLLLAAWVARAQPALALLAWPGAVLVFGGLLPYLPDGYPDVLEAWTLPLAGLLAVAGAIFCAGRQVPTAARWGPALTVALVPSALACWSAPWVVDPAVTGGGSTEHLVRLVLVLVVAGTLLVLGVRAHAAGLIWPAVVAVAVAGSAQLWGGLQVLPRWLALAIVGGALVLAGARFEWVRSEGRRARAWARALR